MTNKGQRHDSESRDSFPEPRPSNETQQEYRRTAKSIWSDGTEKLNEESDQMVVLPDGLEVLILGGEVDEASGTYTTYTLHKYPEGDSRVDGIQIIAAKRSGQELIARCSISVYPEGSFEFDFCNFNQTFGPDTGQSTHEERFERFKKSLGKGNPLPDGQAKELAARDWAAGIFSDSGRIAM